MPSHELRLVPTYRSAPSPSTFEDGAEFADFAAEVLRERIGLHVTTYTSRRWQYERGESREGVEWKYDGSFRRTRRLSIETFERSRCAGGLSWTPSGILAKASSSRYVIGDRRTIYVFDRGRLVDLYAVHGDHVEQSWCKCHGPRSPLRGQFGTVSRFFLPLDDARRIATDVIECGPSHSVLDDRPPQDDEPSPFSDPPCD